GVQLGEQVFLMAAVVGQEHQLRRRRLPIVGDVEEVAVTGLVEQHLFALGGEDVLADDNHAIGVLAGAGAIGKLGDVLGLQTQGGEFAFADDAIFDVDGSLSRLGLDLVTRWTFQLFPSVFREILGLLVEVGPGVVAEDEANAAIRVPVIEVLGLGEIGVAAQ